MMHPKGFNILFFIFIAVFVICNKSFAQKVEGEKQIEVSLRMIGHQVLLNSNDSTSRVLPIKKIDDRYIIEFESEFEFKPETLVKVVDSVVKSTGLAKNYIVEVEDCITNDIVYSFQMDRLEKSDIVPCKSRIQPKSCYSLLFTLIEPESKSQLRNIIIAALAFLLTLLLYFLWKKRNKPSIDPNWIQLGEYYFDKRNTELIIEQKRIELTSKEADLLLLLYDSANTTVEREVILNMVWGDEGDYVGRTLDVFISKLRKKLEFDSKVKIVNIRGVGYKLVMDD